MQIFPSFVFYLWLRFSHYKSVRFQLFISLRSGVAFLEKSIQTFTFLFLEDISDPRGQNFPGFEFFPLVWMVLHKSVKFKRSTSSGSGFTFFGQTCAHSHLYIAIRICCCGQGCLSWLYSRQGQGLLTCPPYPDRLQGPPRHLSNRNSLPEGKAAWAWSWPLTSI